MHRIAPARFAALFLALGAFAERSAAQITLSCDPQAVVGLAVGQLLGLGFPPPKDLANQAVAIVVFNDKVDNGAGAAGQYVDAPSEGFAGPGTIHLDPDGFKERFGSHDDICDPWLVAVVLFHEYQHCPGGGYPGNGERTCGEWKSQESTFSFICEKILADQGELPSVPADKLCAELCTIIAWMNAHHWEYVHTPCTGSSGSIPTPCYSCACGP